MIIGKVQNGRVVTFAHDERVVRAGLSTVGGDVYLAVPPRTPISKGDEITIEGGMRLRVTALEKLGTAGIRLSTEKLEGAEA